MKKFLGITAILTTMFFFTAQVSAQSKTGDKGNQKPIPADLMKVFQHSCSKCHIDGAMAGLRFTEWDSYKVGKQAARAQAICKEVSSDAMPPARFLKNNPSAALSQDQKKSICDWAATLNPAKK
jgi:hypothetical protein